MNKSLHVEQEYIRFMQNFQAKSSLECEATPELEIFEGELHESKTNVTWGKEIRNPLAVSTIKSWLGTRVGKDMIFGDDWESFNLFSRRVNKTLKVAFEHCVKI